LVGALAPDNHFVRAQINQQRLGTFLDEPTPTRWQAGDQLAAPPRKKARQRRLGKTRPQTSQLSVENGIHES